MFEPFVAVVHLVLMIQLIGYEACYGFLVLAAIILFQIVIGKCVTNLRTKASKWTDARLKLLYDVISGIRTIKAYGWELDILVSDWLIQERVKAIRAKETKLLIGLNLSKSLGFAL